MSITLCHISDTHRYHDKITIPPCDVLIHSGDIGGRTNLAELRSFLDWAEAQPVKKVIWIAGNHDIALDLAWTKRDIDAYTRKVLEADYVDAMKMIMQSKTVYLNNTDYIYEGLKFYGSPITPSFHRANWAFNADRGEEISKTCAKIPSDVDVLITHGPPYGVLDLIPESFKSTPDEDVHRGCKDLLGVIKKRLTKLKLHCFGHLHSSYGVTWQQISNTRSALFSNGSVLDEEYKIKAPKPLIITL